MGENGHKDVTQRINWIDWAKSICMFLVVLGHTHIDDSGILVKKIIYSFHMPLFFFLSGLLCKDHISRTSVMRDFKFILIPYLFFGIVGIIIPYPTLQKDIPSYLFNLFLGSDSSIGAIWFLPSIFLCKQLGATIIHFHHKNKKIFLFLLFTSFIPAYFMKDIDLPFFLGSSLCGLPFFLLGHIFMTYDHIFLTNLSNRIICLICLLLISTTIILSNTHELVALAGHSYGNNIYLYYINAITGIFSVVFLSIRFNRTNSYFVFVSAYGSITTIWTHGLFLSFLHYYLFRILNIEITNYSIWLALLFTIITYICCFYTILFLDTKCPTPFGLRGKLKN